MQAASIFRTRCMLLCFALLGLPSIRSTAQIRDSLASIYASASAHGDNFIVDQGGWKAILGKNGRPRTAFLYRELLAGLDGNFVTRSDRAYTLISPDGRTLAIFGGALARIDTAHRIYKVTESSSGYSIYDPAGSLVTRIYPDNQRPDNGQFRWQDERRGLQGVIDSFGRPVVAADYQSVQISQSGIVAMRRDTAFAFDSRGRLRFISRADEASNLGGGLVGLKLYGQWAIKDSTGKLITPFIHWNVEGIPGGAYVEAGGSVLDRKGAEVMPNAHNSIYQEPGGWYRLSYTNMQGDDLRDENLNLIFSGHNYARVEAVGERFIRFYRQYNDDSPKVYDRRLNAFTGLMVERALGARAYLVFFPATKERRILKNDVFLPLPKFDRLEELERESLYRISVNGKEKDEQPGAGIYAGVGAMLRNASDASTERFGLLDTNLNVIVPMGASQIDHLETMMFYATTAGDSSAVLYAADGRLLARVPAGVTPVVTRGLVRLQSANELVILNRDGRIVYRGSEQPAMLFPDAKAEARGYQISLDDIWRTDKAPVLMMYDDSSGYSGVYDMTGRQLLPHQYYAVTQRVAGVFSLKKGDSVYFINIHGTLLYGGRGFFGRRYHLLEGYGVVMQHPSGKWGALDSRGDVQLPFVYDTVEVLPGEGPQRNYVVSANGRHALLNNTGRLRYPLQAWKPTQLVAPDLVLGNDQFHYRILGDSVVRSSPGAYWTEMQGAQVYWRDRFTVVRTGDSGIFNQHMQRVADYHPGFDYPQSGDVIVVTDAAKTRIAVIDTAGRFVLPYVPAPAAVFVSDSAIMTVAGDGRGVLYRRKNRIGRGIRISIDGPLQDRYLQRGTAAKLKLYRREQLYFRLERGGYGFLSYSGRMLIDRHIDTIAGSDHAVPLRRKGLWGILDRGTLTYLQEPVADSVIKGSDRLPMTIYKGGYQGLYDRRSGAYIPPLYREIVMPSTLEQGFVRVRTDAGFALLDRKGRMLTPVLDSIGGEGASIPTMIAYERGAEVSLAIRDSGGIAVERGIAARIRRAGIGGTFAAVVVLQVGGKQGLYSNRSFRMLLPAEYDIISEEKEGGFVAWKYRADKHLGIDSALVIDRAGRVIRALPAGYVPRFSDGYWKLRSSNESPVLTPGGRELLAEGYRLSKLQQRTFFIAMKDGKAGTMDDSLRWIIKPVFDRITTERYRDHGSYVGIVKRGDSVKCALIDREGRQRSAAIYDFIGDEAGRNYFRRGKIKGYLQPDGKEMITPWDKYFRETRIQHDAKLDHQLF